MQIKSDTGRVLSRQLITLMDNNIRRAMDVLAKLEEQRKEVCRKVGPDLAKHNIGDIIETSAGPDSGVSSVVILAVRGTHRSPNYEYYVASLRSNRVGVVCSGGAQKVGVISEERLTELNKRFENNIHRFLQWGD